MRDWISNDVTQLIGKTPLVRIPSLSAISGCDIFAKCEFMNPGGSIKDRAALQMVLDAIESKALRPGMTIVEGTAGNTGIGLSLVAKALGYEAIIVMPNDQSAEKERSVALRGATLKLVPPVPFKDENHFYHTARRIAEAEPAKYWWANQFENPSNQRAHFLHTGPEITAALGEKLDFFVSVSGTGGTIGGVSNYLRTRHPKAKTVLIDPDGSGLYQHFKTGTIASKGSSFTEGIGIMRLTENFRSAKIDEAYTLSDQDLYTVAEHVRAHDGLLVGSSSALNLAGALRTAAAFGPGKTIVTLLCDAGERSASKLFNPEFLTQRGLRLDERDAGALFERYRSED